MNPRIRVETISAEELNAMLDKTYGSNADVARAVVEALPNKEHFCCGGFPPDECVCRKLWREKRVAEQNDRVMTAAQELASYFSFGTGRDAYVTDGQRRNVAENYAMIITKHLNPPPLVKRIDDSTGQEISAEEWERWRWLNVDTHTNSRLGEERFIRGRKLP